MPEFGTFASHAIENFDWSWYRRYREIAETIELGYCCGLALIVELSVMFAKHYQFIALGIMLLLYMLILYTTDFSNLTYWMLFYLFYYGKLLARLLEKKL